MPGLSPYIRTLNANQRTTINARGTTVFLRRATGQIIVTLRSNQVGDRNAESYTLRMTQAEKWFHASEFDSVIIQNAAGVANTIEFYIGFGDFEKPVPDIVNVTFTLPDTADFESLADVGGFGQGNANKATILPADSTRLYAIITALAGNADTLRIGDTNVDTDQGTPLAPGETLRWESKGETFACSEGATASQLFAINVFRSE